MTGTGDIEFTGERMVPEKSPPDLVAEHLARYRFALEYVTDRKVLDLGCGTGYGCRMLAERAWEARGVDISPEAIAYATDHYENEKVGFHESDVKNLKFGDDEFNAVVCFEVIEHIENPEEMLGEVGRILTADGVFIVSTPNGAVKVSSVPNPFHVKEFKIDEIREILEHYFPADKWIVEIFGQFLKGKKYSEAGVKLKNTYLAIKGILGIKPREKLPEIYSHNTDTPPLQYDFSTHNAHLAEYLIAIVSPR
ncbi:MAG TPA: class I SAM-dependent methyltransferase [bacterium]|jgi:ubiquinone/menaquinone biosynthesis C-methylase UbiE